MNRVWYISIFVKKLDISMYFQKRVAFHNIEIYSILECMQK